jgi:hypothetical protein
LAVATHGSETPRVEVRAEVSTIRLPLRKNADLAASVTSLSARKALRIVIGVEGAVGTGVLGDADERRVVGAETLLEVMAARDLAKVDEEEEVLEEVEDVELAILVEVDDAIRKTVEGVAAIEGLALDVV